MNVEVVHWNPRLSRLFGRFDLGPRTNNFGDLLGPVIVRRVREELGLTESVGRTSRLLAVGSILRLANDGDTVWGTGANGKSLDGPFRWRQLDVRAVRGPLTAAFLRDRGIDCPPVYGDPGLLVGHFWSRNELVTEQRHREVTIVPNFHDYPTTRTMYPELTLNPRGRLWNVIGKIAASDYVVGSSLHGIVIAESLGIPARLVVSETEPAFKYEDYFLGTGRDDPDACPSVDEALKLGGGPGLDWNPHPLLAAFPADLYQREEHA